MELVRKRTALYGMCVTKSVYSTWYMNFLTFSYCISA